MLAHAQEDVQAKKGTSQGSETVDDKVEYQLMLMKDLFANLATNKSHNHV